MRGRALVTSPGQARMPPKGLPFELEPEEMRGGK
jgi:hypothetical protein